MNGVITYGFGKIYNPGDIILYGMGNGIRPFIILNFNLSIEQIVDFSLVR